MSEPIVVKTAKAIYRADLAPRKVASWDSLSRVQQRRYESMAAAALSVALRITVDEEAAFVLSLPEPQPV
jgi:hypothetical protein